MNYCDSKISITAMAYHLLVSFFFSSPKLSPNDDARDFAALVTDDSFFSGSFGIIGSGNNDWHQKRDVYSLSHANMGYPIQFNWPCQLFLDLWKLSIETSHHTEFLSVNIIINFNFKLWRVVMQNNDWTMNLMVSPLRVRSLRFHTSPTVSTKLVV